MDIWFIQKVLKQNCWEWILSEQWIRRKMKLPLVNIQPSLWEEMMLTSKGVWGHIQFNKSVLKIFVAIIPPSIQISVRTPWYWCFQIRSEATLLFCKKRVYIFLVYNCAFWRFCTLINQFISCSNTSVFNHLNRFSKSLLGSNWFGV